MKGLGRIAWVACAFLASMPPIWAASVVIINADGPNEGFNDPILGAQRLASAQAAANAVGQQLISNVTIEVAFSMDPFACPPFIGFAAPAGVWRDFPGAMVANTWYPYALANALANQDLDTENPDILATFNSSVDSGCLGPGTGWCYDIPAHFGAPNCLAPGDIDFSRTVYHELLHGLGMLTFADTATGQLLLGRSDVFLNNLVDNQTGLLLPLLTAQQRATVFVSANRLKWQELGAVGSKALQVLNAGVNAQGRVRMYAPDPLVPASSVAHWDTTVTPNEIMEPALTVDARNLIATEAMSDIGWSVNQQPQMCAQNLAEGVLCLLDGRFRLETGSSRGGGQPYSIDKLTDSVGLGNYYNTNNLVTMQKVVDNCGPAGVYTFWWGGITLYDTVVFLTDLETGETRVYVRLAGDPSIRDTWPCS